MSEPRACVFCGCSDCKISKEHAWPKWTRKLVGPPGSSRVQGSRRHGQPVGTVNYTVVDDMGVRVNRVCRVTCNSGWMHELEAAVEPILTPLILGHDASLDMSQQIVVARWVIKTAMVLEFTSEHEPFYTFAERSLVRQENEGSLAPSLAWTCVWLGSYDGPYQANAHGSVVNFYAQVGNLRTPMPGLSTVLSIGSLVCQALTIRVPPSLPRPIPIRLEPSWRPKTIRIWPSDEEVRWPPPERVDQDGFDKMNNRFALRIDVR